MIVDQDIGIIGMITKINQEMISIMKPQENIKNINKVK